MSNLNGTDWTPEAHKVKAWNRTWDVVVRLNTGSELFECICPALPDCIAKGITSADALDKMPDEIDKYLKAGRGGFKPSPGPGVRVK